MPMQRVVVVVETIADIQQPFDGLSFSLGFEIKRSRRNLRYRREQRATHQNNEE
jgi:hypothetical protein